MKIYKDTITHYRRNQLDDHAACGDDLLGRRNEDQLDPFNTTCRDCLVSTGRHHSTFQNLSNFLSLKYDFDLMFVRDKSLAYDPDIFTRFIDMGVHQGENKIFLQNILVYFDHKWAIDSFDPQSFATFKQFAN